MKKVFIPHIHYQVEVHDVKHKDNPLPSCAACTSRVHNSLSRVYIKLPVKPSQVPLLAHELVHVLQHICNDRGIDFVTETEHSAYVMHFMLNKILGYEMYRQS